MKWNCGPTFDERVERLSEWHDHFALWPRRIASRDCRWLETIQRKGEFVLCCDFDRYWWQWNFSYRAKP